MLFGWRGKVQKFVAGCCRAFLRVQKFFGRLAARHATFAGGLGEGFRGRDGTQHIEQRGISGNLQIEIERAVDQDAAQSEHTGQSDGAADLARSSFRFS